MVPEAAGPLSFLSWTFVMQKNQKFCINAADKRLAGYG